MKENNGKKLFDYMSNPTTLVCGSLGYFVLVVTMFNKCPDKSVLIQTIPSHLVVLGVLIVSVLRERELNKDDK